MPTGTTVPNPQHVSVAVGALTSVSGRCGSSNAEVESIADPALGYVYEEWIGCSGIGFARSLDGGATFQQAVTLPLSCVGTVARCSSWDPSIALGPGGRIYAAFMVQRGGVTTPVVDVSSDHGASFTQQVMLYPSGNGNWGDRDFIAVSPSGTVYVTWDYGPQSGLVHLLCPPGGSCSFSRGDLNGAFQESTDGGQTWTPIHIFTPGYPAGGFYGAPLLVEPSGRIDALYIGHGGGPGYQLDPGHVWFTASTDSGARWTSPLMLGPEGLTESLTEWWIDGDLSSDAAENLYATWDTQSSAGDIGWLAYSLDHGRTWSPLVRVTPDAGDAVHIVQVAGGPSGVAYVAWLSNAPAAGYAMYVRPFSTSKGWLAPATLVSTTYGARSVWPGDTFGISVLAGGRVSLGWGVSGRIYEAVVTYKGLS